MRFSRTSLDGVWLVEPVPEHDERGFFARTFCIQEYVDHGLEAGFVQHSTSYSRLMGTLRGLHFQHEPHAEVKIVSCIKGVIWDVVVDLRPGSQACCQWAAFDLSAQNRRQLYIPKGFAHGFQSLCDDVEVGYLISGRHVPSAASGVRYDDPAFGVQWPLPPAMVSDRDRHWPDYNRSRHERS